jgi:Leucine-rich repeat (LRR) protein
MITAENDRFDSNKTQTSSLTELVTSRIANQNITRLDLSFNNLKVFNIDLPLLEMLDLKSNCITKMPVLSRYPLLKRLIISNNLIEFIPKQSNSIKYLDISFNKLKQLQGGFFKQFRHCLTIDLSHNEICKMPYPFKSDLKSLNLSHNSLYQLDGNFGIFEFLEYVNLGYNQIQSIESTFELSHNIKTLLLDHNPLQESFQMFGMVSLQVLDLSGTKITKLDNSMASLAHLKELVLFDHTKVNKLFHKECVQDYMQFIHPPPHIIINGLPEIQNYLRKDHQKQYKIMNRLNDNSETESKVYNWQTDNINIDENAI